MTKKISAASIKKVSADRVHNNTPSVRQLKEKYQGHMDAANFTDKNNNDLEIRSVRSKKITDNDDVQSAERIEIYRNGELLGSQG